MYGLMFGENPASEFLLALLDLTKDDVGRFRDAYVEKDGEEIAVYTRNGGGNRECWHVDSPEWGISSCKHEAREEETDEIVTLTPEEIEAKGYKPINVFVGGKRQAKTGKRIMKTCYTCLEPASAECGCTGCVIGYRLPAHPLYLRDEDDEFDSTYATIYFRTPEQAVALLKDLVAQEKPNEAWLRTIRELKEGKRPDVVRRLEPMMAALESAAIGDGKN